MLIHQLVFLHSPQMPFPQLAILEGELVHEGFPRRDISGARFQETPGLALPFLLLLTAPVVLRAKWAITGEATRRIKTSPPAQSFPHMANGPTNLEPKNPST